MNSITGTLRKATILEVAIVLVMSLTFVGSVWAAIYPPDGTKPNGPGAYRNPDDGICVIGIKLDGTMLVDWSITNYKDCDAWTESAPGLAGGPVDLVGMNTSPLCLNATNPVVAPNDGYRHRWSTSICYDVANTKGISRVDLDNTVAMCTAKGGTVVTTGKCVAYGWIYLNRKTDGNLPITPGTGLAVVTAGGVTNPADGLGFCYTSVNLTGGGADGGTYTSTATCPSYHNSYALAGSTEWPTAGCNSNPDGCQTQASYDAGLGWSYTSSQCRYSYGIVGNVPAAITNAAGGTTAAANALVDLTTAAYDTMGECLAAGFSWDNWLPVTKTTEKTSADAGYTGMPTGTPPKKIKKLNALDDVDHGGGDFISGTGAVCQKCHADQSRGYLERDKPGFPETRHKLAGDAIGKPFQPHFTAAGSDWGLKGVQCAMCHSTSRPASDDLIQIQPAGLLPNELCTGAGAPWSCCTGFQAGSCTLVTEGSPKSASGHNNTEYGSQLVDLCYTCHGTPAAPVATNPASVIPSTTTDFTLTSFGLAPITNQFLNSPHAKYIGNSSKIDVGNKTRYTSPFAGWICRSAATQFRSSAGVFPGQDATTCAAGGHTWYTGASMGTNKCYYNATSCGAVGGTWTSSFDTVAYPWAVGSLPDNPGNVCYGVGLGSIITTYYRGGEAHKIHFLDSTSNPACTNLADTSPNSGASGYWVRDGETSLGNPTSTDQGTCMTCHDVHWALASEVPHAEPLRRECTTCHVNTGVSASAAPQIDPTRINHLAGAGSPLANLATHPNESCEFCHMPKSSATGSPMHLFRINTGSTYTTMGATQANSAADGAYAGASWVDIDHSCGQCHYTNGLVRTSTIPAPNWPVFTRGQMALRARGIHGVVTPPNPTPVASQTCGFAIPGDANIWKVTVTDTSANQSYIAQETVNWADGSTVADDRVAPFGPFEHTYISPGTYTILHTVVDNQGQVDADSCQVTLSYFTISGTVTAPDATTTSGLCTAAGVPWACCTGAGTGATCDTDTMPVSGVNVTATNTATAQTASTAVTIANGTYTLGSLKPGSYTVAFVRAGFSFPVPATWVVGPSQVGVDGAATPDLGRVRVRPPTDPKNFKSPGKLTTGPRVN